MIKDAVRFWDERKGRGDPIALKVLPELEFKSIDFLKKGDVRATLLWCNIDAGKLTAAQKVWQWICWECLA